MAEALNTTRNDFGIYNISKTGAVLHHELRDGNESDIDMYDINDKAIAIAVPLVFAIIFVVGLIGNACVIGAVLRFKSMRSAPNLFIVNLAVGDVLMIVMSVPTSALIYTIDTWPFGATMCKISYFIKTLSLGVSIFTLTALSIDRVLVISQTMKVRQEKTSQRILIMVITVWVLATIIAIPDAIAYNLKTLTYEGDPTPMILCLPHPVEWSHFDYPKIHATTHIVIFFLLPLVIITICYGIMAHIMMKSSHGIPGESIENSTWRKKQIATRRKVANIVIVLIILFFICWLPRSIFILMTYYKAGMLMTPAIYYFRMVSYCLQFSNCCVNPIALYFLSKSFKSMYMKQLCCGRKWKLSDTDLATKQSHTAQGECQVLMKINNNKIEHTDQTESYDTMLTSNGKNGHAH